MQPSHVTGGVLGVVLGIVTVGLLKHYSVTSFSDSDAVAIGGGAAAAGVAIAHAFWNIGIVPIFRRVVHGPAQPSAPATPPPAPTPIVSVDEPVAPPVPVVVPPAPPPVAS